jgi:formylmethanofuran--tetrahydromethanopterin N-formyltransferase
MKAGIAVPAVSKITAGNYGGMLGKYQFQLKDLC